MYIGRAGAERLHLQLRDQRVRGGHSWQTITPQITIYYY